MFHVQTEVSLDAAAQAAQTPTPRTLSDAPSIKYSAAPPVPGGTVPPLPRQTSASGAAPAPPQLDSRMRCISKLGERSMNSTGGLAGAGQGGASEKGRHSCGRCDFVLQGELTEMEWYGAFKAHFCYWRHEDVALFVTRAVCGYDVVDGGKLPSEAQ